ncbi:MAG: hypothetical protein WEB78_10380 [Ilumatobacteraceae bacterium]
MGIFKKKPPAETVDVVELRNEVIELKDRLAAAEQAKASLDDRLSSLAATTMVLSSATKNDTAELVDQIEDLQARLATTTAVGVKVDELHQRVIDVEQRPAGVGGAPDQRIGAQLDALTVRLDQVAELAAAPVAPDDELAARLDLLTAAADTVSAFDHRVADLDARIAQQATLADEVTSLRQRLDDVSATATEVALVPAPAPADLDERFSSVTGQVEGRLEVLTGQVEERLAAINARIAATEAEARAAREYAASLEAQLEHAAAITPDQITAHVGPQLELLGARIDEQVGSVHERLAAAEHDARTAREQVSDLDSMRSQVAAQAMLAARVGSLDDRVREVQHRVDEVGAAQGAPLPAIDELRQRIDEVAAAIPTVPDNTETERRVGALAERVALTAEDARIARDSAAALHERLAADTSATANADALVELRNAMTARLDELGARLAATEEENAALRSAATELQQRLDDTHVAAPADDVVQGLVAASHASIDGRVDEIWERIVVGEQQADTVRAQAAALEEQLANTSTRIDELAALETRVDHLSTLEPRITELAALETRIAELAALESRVDELGVRGVDVDGLLQRLDEIAATVPDTTGLQAELARFAVRVETSELDAQTARDQAAQLDDRLQSVSTQLANQLAELGREIDSLATRETTTAVEVDDAVVQSLRSGQVRLATEQARYEISFREDLALLAEQVRQLRGRNTQ